jgi:hypothetical protein
MFNIAGDDIEEIDEPGQQRRIPRRNAAYNA